MQSSKSSLLCWLIHHFLLSFGDSRPRPAHELLLAIRKNAHEIFCYTKEFFQKLLCLQREFHEKAICAQLHPFQWIQNQNEVFSFLSSCGLPNFAIAVTEVFFCFVNHVFNFRSGLT